MKINIVTGAAGFIGSHIVQRLLSQDEFVHGIDNFSSSSPGSLHHKENLQHKKYSFVPGDITNEIHLNIIGANLVDMNKIEPVDLHIYNFACPASPPNYMSKPLETLATCTTGVSNIFDFAFTFKQALRSVRVLHASTSEVYGDPLITPQVETYYGNVNPFGPRSCYDEGKRVAESYAYEYKRLGVDIGIVRIFNTYGPHMNPNDGRVMTEFIKNIHKGIQPHIFGGNQTRSFCYITDLIDGLQSLINSNINIPVNIGGSDEITMTKLFYVVRDVIGKHKGIDLSDLQPIIDLAGENDPMRRRADTKLARSLLGWEQKVTLVDGIRHMYEYMLSEGSI